MATSKIKMTFGFSDGLSRELSIEPFAPTATALANAKAQIKTFNSTGLANVDDVLLSDDGGSCTGIIAASIVTSDKTNINLNDA